MVHCTAGIDMIPSESVALDPNVLGNISFSMHSFHAIGKINHCERMQHSSVCIHTCKFDM